MTEPTPPKGEHVPDTVLDELKQAFAAPEPARTEPEPEPAPATTEPAPEPAPAPPEPAPAPVPDSAAPTEPRRATPARPTIVIGGEDELPDPVYLDDAEIAAAAGGPAGRTAGPSASRSDVSAERGTIVIGDELDSTGAFDAVSVPSRSMDPRVRARRIAVKRAEGRKRLLWAAGIAGVLLLAVAALAVFSSSLFAVERVDVQGAVYTDEALLQAVVDDLMGQPVLLVDTQAAERELESIAWVERAFVITDFPNRVVIDIRERQPLATFQGSDSRFRVIDRDGRVLDVLDNQPVDYMLLTGPAPDVEPGSLAGTPFAQAAQMVSALPAEIRSLTLSASVDATTGDLGLVLAGPDDVPIDVRIGTFSGLDAKLARLLQQIRDGLDGVTRIDVSTDEVSRTEG